MESVAVESIRKNLEKCGVTIKEIRTQSAIRACRNAYGKEMSEKDFEAISPDDDEYWFDDYDFVFMADVESEDMDDAEIKKILREKMNCLV